MALSAQKDLKINQIDGVTALLQGELNDEKNQMKLNLMINQMKIVEINYDYQSAMVLAENNGYRL